MNASYDEIMEIAKQQLAEWKPKLSRACYAALKANCEKHWRYSNKYKEQFPPLDIFRGTSMCEFIANWRPKAKK